MLSKAGIGLKIILLPVVTALFFSLFLALYILPEFSRSIMQERKLQTQELVRTAISILTFYEASIQEGTMTDHEAKDSALKAIQAMRYGAEGKDYFWIQNDEPRMIMHPFKPQLDGQLLHSIADKYGSGYIRWGRRSDQTAGCQEQR